MNPNRIAALVGVAAAVVTGVLIPLLGVVENDIARAVVLSVLILSVAAVLIVWLLGWQKHEQRVAAAREYDRAMGMQQKAVAAQAETQKPTTRRRTTK